MNLDVSIVMSMVNIVIIFTTIFILIGEITVSRPPSPFMYYLFNYVWLFFQPNWDIGLTILHVRPNTDAINTRIFNFHALIIMAQSCGFGRRLDGHHSTSVAVSRNGLGRYVQNAINKL